MKFQAFLLCCFLFLIASAAVAQGKEDAKDKELEKFKEEIQQLRRELDSLKAMQQAPAPDQADELDRLEERIEQRLQELENKIDAVSRASAPVVLNPRMTAFLNFAARGDNWTAYDLADPANEISNKMFLRTVELEIRNPVDPYAEAVAVISVENEAGAEFAIDAEEAYGLIKKLPILETAPLGLKMKIGKFRAPLGVNNKIHLHDLPWTTRPLVISRFLGTEHGDFFEAGYNPTGIDLDFFLPNPIPQTTLEMNLSLARAGELGLSQGNVGTQPAYIGHLNLSRDWSNEHLLTLGLSAYFENGGAPTRLYGADITYKWAPSEQRESHSFVAGGEVFSGRHSYTDTSSGILTNAPIGWYGYLQYQTSYWLYLGLRYDWVQEPVDDKLITRSIAGYLSYYTTEFLRFRLGFEHRLSDIAAQDNANSAIFEVNFVFGSHPTEPYWVNR